MDDWEFLLGRPWMYDKDIIHLMRDHAHTFFNVGNHVTLYSMKPKPPVRGSRVL